MSSGPSNDELRAALHRAADWAADFVEHVDELPVGSRVRPGEVRAALPQHPPATGESLQAMIDDVDRVIVPGLTHWNHPGFLAYFANTGSGPGILAEMMAATLNVNAMLWQTSPAATELEQVVLEWAARARWIASGAVWPDHRLGVHLDLHRARRSPGGRGSGRARPGDGRAF